MTETLRIAMVHYHLRPGGVTRVIERAVSALSKKNIRATILTGEVPLDGGIQAPDIQLVEGLGYGQGRGLAGEDLFSRLKEAAERGLGAAPDIWHFHNHSLGKNTAVPRTVEIMARAGLRLLLQIHDFAEDGRPQNYRLLFNEIGGSDAENLGLRLYPRAEHVHYAVLNGRDMRFLSEAGLPEEQLHYLPNPVSIQATEKPAAKPSAGRMFLYPSRAIRRKNIGEFIFWSALADKDDRFAITLEPKNPIFRPVYDRWVEFAKSLGLPVEFNLAAKTRLTFYNLMRSACALVSTSVAEGFGLAFIEPWLVERPLVGRKLPEITEEFEQAGVDLAGMYSFLGVPIEWVGSKALREKVESEFEKFLDLYGRKLKHGDVDRALSAMTRGGKIDFARLDETFQESVIRRVFESDSARREIEPQTLEAEKTSVETIESNRKSVNMAFSLDSCGNRLARIYKEILSSKTGKVGGISAQTLLDRFLAPERFYLLRTT